MEASRLRSNANLSADSKTQYAVRRQTMTNCLEKAMKIKNSLRTLKTRERHCRVIRRRGRVYVINKRQPRFKARQG